MDWVKTRLSPRERSRLEGVPGVVLGEGAKDKVHLSHFPLIEREIDAVDVPQDPRFRPYQAEGVAFLLAREGALLADSCGLGKTRQALGAIKQFPVVVVGPKIAVRERGVWLAEAHEFFPDAKCEVLTGRKQTEIPPADFYFINYDILHQRWGQFFEKALGTVVVDEAHKIGNRKTQRTRAVQLLASCARVVYAVTATPMPNRPENLFPLLHLINSGAWGGFWDFAKRYADARPNYYGMEAKGLSNKDELRHRLRAVMLQRFWYEVSDQVPSVARERVVVDLAPKARRTYKQIEADLRLAAKRRVKAAKLQQITALRKFCGLEKTKPVVDFLLDRVPEESVVVWVWHHEVADQIAASLAKRGVESVRVTGAESGPRRDAAIERFQTKTVPVMLAQYEAAGVSADFTAARLAVFCELDWLNINLQQAEGRTWRWKQTRGCLMYYFVVEDSIEEKILDYLWKKASFTADALGDQSQLDVLSQIDERANVDAREEILDMIEAMVAAGVEVDEA